MRSLYSKRLISKQKAISIATMDAGGILATSTEAELKNYWRITLHFRSAHPPMCYIIDPRNERILLKLDNADDPEQQKRLKEFLSANDHEEK